MSLKLKSYLSPKALLTSATLALTPAVGYAQTTAENINTAIAEAMQSSIPTGSNLAAHAETQPAEIVAEIEAALAHFRQAEADDQTPPRSEAQFNQILNRIDASIRMPEDPYILDFFPEARTSLLNRLTEGQTGLFVDGAAKHLYVVERRGNQLVAIRQMDVSTARNGFNNQIGSNGSPYGPMTISSVHNERVGEVIIYNNTPNYRRGDLVNGTNGTATMSSFRLSLIGVAETDTARLDERGVAFHGTKVGFNDDGELVLNQEVSGGCFRMYGTDGIIVGQSHVEEGTPVQVSRNRETSIRQPVTPVIIASDQPNNLDPITNPDEDLTALNTIAESAAVEAEMPLPETPPELACPYPVGHPLCGLNTNTKTLVTATLSPGNVVEVSPTSQQPPVAEFNTNAASELLVQNPAIPVAEADSNTSENQSCAYPKGHPFSALCKE